MWLDKAQGVGRRLALALVRVGVFFAAVLGLLFFLAPSWDVEASSQSKNGSTVASILQSVSEAGLAPYGSHVVLTPSWRVWSRTMTEPIFAGYCVDRPGVIWNTDSSITISCKTSGDGVIRQDTRWRHIRITYEFAPAT